MLHNHNRKMNTANKFLYLALSLPLLLCFAKVAVGSDDDCVYTVFLRTGSIWKAGTDSIIGLKLYDQYGYYIYITNLTAWGGIMEPGHKYYERGNLDIFSGRGSCLDGPVCAINITSDGSGAHHGWYCNYAEISTTGVHTACSKQQFTIEQWLATDTSPYQLSAVRNYCPNHIQHPRLKAIVPNRRRPDPSVANPESVQPKSALAWTADA